MSERPIFDRTKWLADRGLPWHYCIPAEEYPPFYTAPTPLRATTPDPAAYLSSHNYTSSSYPLAPRYPPPTPRSITPDQGYLSSQTYASSSYYPPPSSVPCAYPTPDASPPIQGQHKELPVPQEDVSTEASYAQACKVLDEFRKQGSYDYNDEANMSRNVNAHAQASSSSPTKKGRKTGKSKSSRH